MIQPPSPWEHHLLASLQPDTDTHSDDLVNMAKAVLMYAYMRRVGEEMLVELVEEVARVIALQEKVDCVGHVMGHMQRNGHEPALLVHTLKTVVAPQFRSLKEAFRVKFSLIIEMPRPGDTKN